MESNSSYNPICNQMILAWEPLKSITKNNNKQTNKEKISFKLVLKVLDAVSIFISIMNKLSYKQTSI